MNQAPLVSVVIPNYNYAPFLSDSLDSVLRQSIKDIEILVIDNGSTDGSREVAESKQDLRITFVDVSNGGSIAVSRNLGIQLAKGEFVAFLDSDDLWDSSKLERQLASMSSNTSLSHHRLRFFGRRTRGRTNGRSLGRDPLRDLLAGGNAISTSSVLARTCSIRQLGGFPEGMDVITAEDYALWLRLAHAGHQIAFLPQTLGSYRLHASTSSKVDPAEAARAAAAPYLADAADEVKAKFAGFVAFARGVSQMQISQSSAARKEFSQCLRTAHLRFKVRAFAYILLSVLPRKH